MNNNFVDNEFPNYQVAHYSRGDHSADEDEPPSSSSSFIADAYALTIVFYLEILFI